jgi:nucleoside-diphosphate-sugar epimerase
MKVLVTGGIGNVGKALLERLVKNGWDVRVVDRKPEFEMAGIDYRVGDITKLEDMQEQVKGCDVIVHLAAIPSPTSVPPDELFRINVDGTYNVFEAAAGEGIKRIVQASSINALGCFWGNRDISPEYFPIDEEHPTGTTDVYSFSKELVEDIGAYYWRRNGISSVSMRFPGVWSLARFSGEEAKARRRQLHEAVDDFAALSDAQRQKRLADIRKASLAFRAAGNMEYPAARSGLHRSGYSDDPIFPVYNNDRYNFWAYVDDRDSAQAMEKGLTANFEGHHPLFINAAGNSLNYDSTTLVNLFFPETKTWKRPLKGAETLVSIDKARALIGYEPVYSVS